MQLPCGSPFAHAKLQLGRKGQRPKGQKVKGQNFKNLTEIIFLYKESTTHLQDYRIIYILLGPSSRLAYSEYILPILLQLKFEDRRGFEE